MAIATEQLYGTGRRKTAVARVRLVPGNGRIIINGKTLEEYFNRPILEHMVRAPLATVKVEDRYDVIAIVRGGGPAGQAGAIRHGIARARLGVAPEVLATLRRPGFFTRDPRMNERRRYGTKKARKAPQFPQR